jgi:hypothetical protein
VFKKSLFSSQAAESVKYAEIGNIVIYIRVQALAVTEFDEDLSAYQPRQLIKSLM